MRLGGTVGEDTFGFDRYLNQAFYKSKEWLDVRDYVVARDHGCDLGVEGYEIYDRILIHHINPIEKMDIIQRTDSPPDAEYIISTPQ